MTREDAEKYLRLLGQELQKQDITGEILVYEDICVFIDIKVPEIEDANAYLTNEGDALETIDAYFGGNGVVLSQVVKQLADNELSSRWLQSVIDIVFCGQQNKWVEYPGICIYAPPLDYVFTMKVIASEDQYQETDIVRLAQELKIADAKDAFLVIKKYIPNKLVTSRIRTRIKRCFDSLNKEQKEVVHG